MPNHLDMEENVEDSASWMTISVCDDLGDTSTLNSRTSPSPSVFKKKNSFEDSGLDDTIPLDDLGENSTPLETKTLKSVNFLRTSQYQNANSTLCKIRSNQTETKNCSKPESSCLPTTLAVSKMSSEERINFSPTHVFRQVGNHQLHQNHSDYPNSHLFCRTSSFNPPHSSTQLRQGSDMADFKPQLCSTAAPLSCRTSSFNPPHSSTQLRQGSDMADFKPQLCSTAAPLLCRTSSFNPPLSSTLLRQGSDMADFKPQLCSTAAPLLCRTSSFNPPLSSTLLRQGSDMADFKPQLCSTASIMECSCTTEFKPCLCSTGLPENSSTFVPLRCSTGISESDIFNPLVSSTVVKLDQSNIPEFKNLRVE